VNAAFLIMTSACLTGAEPVPLLVPAPPEAVEVDKAPADKPGDKVPVKPPPPIVGTPGPGCGGGNGCGGCGGGHGCESHRWFSGFRGFWSRGCNNNCNGCGHAQHASHGCDSCSRESFWNRFRSHGCGGGHGCGCDSGGFWGRFRGRGHGCGCDCGSNGHPVPLTPGEPVKVMPKEGEPKKLPEGKEAYVPIVPKVTPSANTTETGTKSPFELSRRFEKRVDHAADYSLLTGQLFYAHADGGLWVLRYAPLDTEDRNGGGVILARDRSMDSYREGDLVTVRGEILQERASRYLGAPLYRTSSILLVERGEP
jgi:hypothetical protein